MDEKLINEYYDYIFSNALNMCRNYQEAEDITQIAMTKAFLSTTSRHEFIRSYLYAILRNTFINKRLKDNRERKKCDKYKYMVSEYTYTEPEDDYILKVFEILPDGIREVCWLFFVEEYKYKEIAEELEVPIGTVMSRIYRGRKVLQKELRHD